MDEEYSILVGGAAGEGSRMAGLTIAKLLNQYGWRVSIYEDYQSLIKGGHSFSKIRATKKVNSAPKRSIDFLIALNKETLEKHKKDLDKDGIAIFDADSSEFEYGFGLSSKQIIEQFQIIPIMKNSAFIGATAKTIGIEWEIVEKVFRKEVKKEIEKNLAVAKFGYDQADTLIKIQKLKNEPMPLITGNETTALGAVKAGLGFYAAYPMTPATSILHFLAEHKADFKIDVFQAENEISVINSALGAASAGKRSMVGTSGGGMALMAEAISFAAQGEIPVVLVNSQRPGPATGLPTYSGQADLKFSLNMGHGDFDKILVAPGDADESFYLSGLAMNLAWKYQTPVLFLTDKNVSESTFSFDTGIVSKINPVKELLWDGKGQYKRYLNTKSGISPMAFYGQDNATVRVTSYEHYEDGITLEEEEDLIIAMNKKKERKYAAMKAEIEKLNPVKVYGNKNASKAIIAWGYNKGLAKEVAENLNIKFIQPVIMQPFPIKAMQKALKGVKKLVLVESSAIGQLSELLAQNSIKVNDKILNCTGRSFYLEDLQKEVSKKIK